MTVQAGWSPPKKARPLPLAISAKSSRRSKDSSRPLLADGPQQRHRQGAAADASLDDRRPGEDVGHLDDLAGVLGVDDGGSTRHRHDVVAEQRPQREVLDVGGVGHDGAVGRTDEVVVAQEAAVGVELASRARA